MLWAALDVLDALPTQLFDERRLPPPRHVLPPLVRQDFLGRPVLRDAPFERLHHQFRFLPVRQRVRHDEARVVVHERRQVQPLVAPQQKREDVRLPQLVRRRPLEPPRRMRPRRFLARSLQQQPLLVQDPPHHRLRHSQHREPSQHVADPPRPVLRVLPPQRRHRLPLRHRGRRLPLGLRTYHLRRQALQAARFVPLHPVVQRPLVHPEDPAHLHHRRLLLQHLPHQPHPELQRVHAPRPVPDHRLAPPAPFVSPPSLALSPLPWHRRLLSLATVSGVKGRSALTDFHHAHARINWCAAHGSGWYRSDLPRSAPPDSASVGRGTSSSSTSCHRGSPRARG